MSFITGSHAYGEPNEKSDIDLVIHCEDLDTLRLLQKEGIPVRFDELNLIICDDETEYSIWRLATTALKHKKKLEKRPIGREEARIFITQFREMCNRKDRGDSGEFHE